MSQPQYQLEEFTAEDAAIVKEDLDSVLAEHSAQLVVAPIINQNGTIGAKVEIFKKVELVARDSVLSPIQPNKDGEIPADEGTEPEAETAS